MFFAAWKSSEFFSWILLLLIGLWVGQVQGADDLILERTRRALDLRKELLLDYSVEVHQSVNLEGPFGKQELESWETHFLGAGDQFKRERIELTRNGLPVGPEEGRWGARFTTVMPQLRGRDVLTAEGFLRKPQIVPNQPDASEWVEIEVRPKVRGTRVKQARLWVSRSSAMPVRLEMQFAVGAFISEAHLVMDLDWDEKLEITVPATQRVELTGGFRGGMGRRGFGGGGEEWVFPGEACRSRRLPPGRTIDGV